MGLFKRIRDKPEKRNRLTDYIKGIDEDGYYGGSGFAVDEQKAMQTSAVFACVKVLSETVASLPLFLYKSGAKGNKVKAVEHPLYEVLQLHNVGIN